MKKKSGNTDCDHTPPLKAGDIKKFRGNLDRPWKIIKGHHLERQYNFRNFRDALSFTNRIGALAEKQGHHPDLYLTWGEVRVQLWTHNSDGLTLSDFTLAAKIDRLKRPA